MSHENCYRKEPMPQIENGTQIKTRMPKEGVRTGLTIKEKRVVTGNYIPRYRKAAKKEQSAIPAEFTRLTGYHRKSADRILGGRPLADLPVFSPRVDFSVPGGHQSLHPPPRVWLDRRAWKTGSPTFAPAARTVKPRQNAGTGIAFGNIFSMMHPLLSETFLFEAFRLFLCLRKH
jgi:hypothetical protein